MKERVLTYDYIRIVAMLLVVACHCFGSVSTIPPSLISLLSYFEMPCNGLFFAVSGALLLPVNTSPNEAGTFLIKRLKKVVIPTIVWSIIYMLCSNKLNTVSACSIPFSAQGASIFWFMYVMVGLYIIAPVISPFLEKTEKKTLTLYLGFWMISLCFPILKNWLVINETITGVLYYPSGFIGYFVLGFYLNKFGVKFNWTLFLYCSAFLIMILVKMFANNIKLYDGLWNLSVFCAISVVFYWKGLELLSNKIRLSERAKNCIITSSNLIFGVYFIHYGIIEYVLPHIDFTLSLPYLVGYTVRICIAFISALMLSYIISYLPFANYIIGYKQSKDVLIHKL